MKTFISMSGKLSASIKAKLPVIKKVSSKKNAALDKRISPEALKKSRAVVDEKVRALKLVSAGFGRYHKGKGQPITHWIIRGPKSGKYLLVNRKQRAKILGKPLPAPKAKSKSTKKRVELVPTKRLSALRHELGKVALKRKELMREGNDKHVEILNKRRAVIRKMIARERSHMRRAAEKSKNKKL